MEVIEAMEVSEVAASQTLWPLLLLLLLSVSVEAGWWRHRRWKLADGGDGACCLCRWRQTDRGEVTEATEVK